MVDFARVQNRIYYGYGKAAQRLGSSHAVYRSVDGNNPIQEANFVFNQLISIDQNYKYTSAKKYGDPIWQFLPENGLLLQNFDYFVSPSGINYFIIDIIPDDRLTPPICVECNAILTLYRPVNTRTPGTNTYQAFDPYTAQKILINCPVSILQHTKTDGSNMKLPTSVKLPFYSILIPEFDDIIIKTGDVIIDDKGRRMAVINAERTKKSLGFRIVAGELGA
jgi:hypothetical protein